MAQLLKVGSSQGTVIVEETERGILVTIAGRNKKVFSQSKIVSVDVKPGILLKTVILHMLGGETIELKSMAPKEADELQRLLS